MRARSFPDQSGSVSVPVLRRRDALRAIAGIAATAALAACGDAATSPSPTLPANTPTRSAAASVAPTAAASTVAPVASVPTASAAAPSPSGTTATMPAAPSPSIAPTTAPALSVTSPPSTVPPASTSPAPASPAPASPAPTTGAVASAAAIPNGKTPGDGARVPDAWTRLPPPFKGTAGVPGRGGKVTALMIAYDSPPVPRAQNRYWQELEKRIGAQYDLSFATAASYQEKIAAVTAGGDLPDLLLVVLDQAPDQYRALLQGVYTDLTPYLTGDALKEYPNLAAFPPALWERTAINKKLYGVPRMRYFANNPLWFRQDWAEKVGMAQARNADDFLRLMTAFAKSDPDGNGTPDTFGLTGMSNNVFSTSWLSHMFRVPNGWRLAPDGNLTNEIETEEFRAMVAFARRLWEAGAYHPQAATMSLQQARDAFIGSKIGAYSSGFLELPSASGVRAKTRAASAPNANMVAFQPPGHDGGQPAWRTASPVFGFVAINSRVGRDKERVRELLRILDWWAAPFGSEEYIFRNFGLEGVHHTIKPDGSVQLTDLGRAETAEIPLLMNNPPVFYYPDTPDDGVYLQTTIRQMLSTAVDNPVLTAYSPTATQKTSELGQLQRDRVGAVIVGREPLSALDSYVRDWRGRGGDTIRKELQDALKA